MLEGGFEFGVGVEAEGGPVVGGFDSLAVGGAEPEFDGLASFADVRVRFERKGLVQFYLQFGRVGFVVVVERSVGVKELEFFAVGPSDGLGG